MHPFFATTDWYRVQKTVKRSVAFEGIGIHTGAKVALSIDPAPANHGLVFERSDTTAGVRIPAHFRSVVGTELATTLGVAGHPETFISTVEHVLSALYGMGVTNALLRVHGPEIPILDGSAAAFVEAITSTGFQLQPFSTSTLRILKPVKVYRNDVVCELLPRDHLRLTTSVDFPHPSIGLQIYALELTPQSFTDEVVSARTFGFLRDVDRLKAKKFALGASLENVLAFSETEVVNPEGMRFPDECVRHKILDAIGDLALCGSWLEAEMVSFRGGHSMHLALLEALQSQPTHFAICPAEPLASPSARATFDELMDRPSAYAL